MKMFADHMKLDIAFEMIDDTKKPHRTQFRVSAVSLQNSDKYGNILFFLKKIPSGKFISSVPYMHDDITWCM